MTTGPRTAPLPLKKRPRSPRSSPRTAARTRRTLRREPSVLHIPVLEFGAAWANATLPFSEMGPQQLRKAVIIANVTDGRAKGQYTVTERFGDSAFQKPPWYIFTFLALDSPVGREHVADADDEHLSADEDANDDEEEEDDEGDTSGPDGAPAQRGRGRGRPRGHRGRSHGRGAAAATAAGVPGGDDPDMPTLPGSDADSSDDEEEPREGGGGDDADLTTKNGQKWKKAEVRDDWRTAPRSNARMKNDLGPDPSPLLLFEQFFPTTEYAVHVAATNVEIEREFKRKIGGRKKRSRKGATLTSVGEYKKFLGVLIALALHDGPRRDAWRTKRVGIVPPFELGRHGLMRDRFELLLRCWRLRHEPEESEGLNPWWMVRGFVAAWNDNMEKNFDPPFKITPDDSMFFFYGRGMPHLTFIARKPRALGCEAKTVACGMTHIMIRLEIQDGKAPMS